METSVFSEYIFWKNHCYNLHTARLTQVFVHLLSGARDAMPGIKEVDGIESYPVFNVKYFFSLSNRFKIVFVQPSLYYVDSNCVGVVLPHFEEI